MRDNDRRSHFFALSNGGCEKKTRKMSPLDVLKIGGKSARDKHTRMLLSVLEKSVLWNSENHLSKVSGEKTCFGIKTW